MAQNPFKPLFGRRLKQSKVRVITLTSNSLKVMKFIQKTSKGKSWAVIDRAEFSFILNLPTTTVFNCLKVLVNVAAISKRSAQSEYWINLQVLFSGDCKVYAEMHAPNSIKFIPDKNPTIVDVSETRFDPNKTYLI